MEEWSVPRVGSRFEGREKEKFALVAFSRQNEDGRNSEDVKLSQYSSAQISSGRRRMLYTRKMGYFDNRFTVRIVFSQFGVRTFSLDGQIRYNDSHNTSVKPARDHVTTWSGKC
jgi:hypothetical protein